MNTVEIVFDGVPLIVPTISGMPVEFPADTFEDFPTYCGPGKLGDALVPDDIFDVPINPACFIHDIMGALAEPSWDDFHYTNSVFLHNILTIIEHKAPDDSHKYARYYRAVTYYAAVDSGAGAHFFWRDKGGKPT